MREQPARVTTPPKRRTRAHFEQAKEALILLRDRIMDEDWPYGQFLNDIVFDDNSATQFARYRRFLNYDVLAASYRMAGTYGERIIACLEAVDEASAREVAIGKEAKAAAARAKKVAKLTSRKPCDVFQDRTSHTVNRAPVNIIPRPPQDPSSTPTYDSFWAGLHRSRPSSSAISNASPYATLGLSGLSAPSLLASSSALPRVLP